MYKIEVPANRYDLLCVEGLSIALRVFLGLSTPPAFTAALHASSPIVFTQHADTLSVRPFIVGAVLRGLSLSEGVYRSFIDLQDKLHQNIGRRRTLVAIGTHDLDTLTPPFTYTALPQQSISFRPLSEDREYSVDALFSHYRQSNSHLLPYLPITESAPLHPVILDAKGVVLSLPPIINGAHSRLQLHTRNVLIEMTGTDYTKLAISLNTLVAMFSQYAAQPFHVEQVRVVDAAGRAAVTPQLECASFTASVEYINRGIGINMLAKDMVQLLGKMSLQAQHEPADNTLTVTAPITRTDILHACDVMEDVAIAYGYNRIPKLLPATFTIARQQPINRHGDQLREAAAQAGWTEVLTWALVSAADNGPMMRKPDDGRAVVISQPKTAEFEQVRTSLLPGLLRALCSNKGLVNLPVRLFELGDICLCDSKSDVGARNERRLAALYCGVSSGFEHVHGLMDRLLQQNGLHFLHDEQPPASASAPLYRLLPSDLPSFFPGRQAQVLVGEGEGALVLGSFGVLHPDVLAAFELPHPCSAMELDVSVLMTLGGTAGAKGSNAAEDAQKPRAPHEHEHGHGDGKAYVH